MQVFGGARVSQDIFEAYAYARFMRMGDGPDQIHLSALGKALVMRHGLGETSWTAQAEPRPRFDAALLRC